MTAFDCKRVRNIGIIAHIDAGKTTVSERILFFTGREHRIGEVHDGTTTTDWMEEERARGITITAACTTVMWKDHCINIVDTPGHVDFTAEVERSLRVLDGAVVVFAGVEGVEAQSETVWHQSDRYHVPKIAFINKLDRVGADFDRVTGEIAARFNVLVLPLQVPIGVEAAFTGFVDLITQKAHFIPETAAHDNIEIREIPADMAVLCAGRREALIEKLADHDDDLMERYLEGREIPHGVIKRAIRHLTCTGKAVPVVCGSALKNRGVRGLLDAIVDYLPAPNDIPVAAGTDPRTGAPVERKRNAGDPFAALAFKVQNDVHGGITYLRLYSGRLDLKGRIFNSTRDRIEKVGRIFRMHAEQREAVEEAVAGDIVAVAGLKFTVTGDTLCDQEHPVLFERMRFPETVVAMSIEPVAAADEARLTEVLGLIAKDDPTFTFRADAETGQTLIAGMGELHLEVIGHRVVRDHNLKVNMGRPRVSYRETVGRAAVGEGLVDTQMGDLVRYAQVQLEAAPGGRGSGFAFVNGLKLPGTPPLYIKAAEQGVRDSLLAGTIMGYPVIDVRVTLLELRFKAPGTDETAMNGAASIAFREALKQGAPVILEPFMKVAVMVPPEYVGDTINFFNMRRGEIVSSDVKGGMRTLEVSAPLRELFGFASRFRSVTQGRGLFTMEPREYRVLPEKLRKEGAFF
ncbi:MAG: elongation factor G [Planctomycetota bacterium]